jgi:hypothetical protein
MVEVNTNEVAIQLHHRFGKWLKYKRFAIIITALSIGVVSRPNVVETRSISRLYIRGSKAKEKRKKGISAKGYGRPYITPPGHMASLRSVAVFPWPGQGNQNQSGLSRKPWLQASRSQAGP